MSRLDINTENGRIAAGHQARAIAILSAFYGRQFIQTSDKDAASIDAMSFDDEKVLTGLFEVKSRPNVTTETLKKSFGNEWIVTFEKVLDGMQMSRHLRVPFFGVMYLPEIDTALLVKITNSEGDIVVPCRIDRTFTQATCNTKSGKKVVRTNAYVSMKSAKEISIKQPA